MAAGEGRRLRPLTERWAKPVLPVDGRPVIGTLLRELADGGVERVLDDDPRNPLAGAPLWLLGPGAARFLDPLPGKPPYELSTVLQLAVDSGEQIAGIEIGPTRDLTAPLDLVRENFPYLGA